jgi:hypothetical protein
MSRRGARALLAAAGAAAVLLAPACGGGGGGGGPTQPPMPQPGITFTPGGAAGANSVALVRVGQSTTRLSLELRATGVTDLYGVSFDLRFPSSALSFVDFDEGPMLLGGGIFDTAFQVVETPAGNLVVGATRLGGVAGANGDGVLLTLHFDARASGSGGIAFDGPQAFDRDGAQSVQFIGGSVAVVR